MEGYPMLPRSPLNEPMLKTTAMRELFSAIIKLDNNLECMKFLRDLCTLSELKNMSERWQAAILLTKGLPYLEIAKKTGTSTATITRIAHWIHHGTGGYQLMLERYGYAKKHRPRANT